MVAKVEFHFGELFPRVGFLVTNLEAPSRAVVRFYNKRGTAEQWIKEGKQAVKMTRLSPLPLQRGAAGAQPACLQPGEFVAAAGVTQANRELVAHEFAATTGEDGRTAGEARTVLLALTGREPSDEAALQEYGAADRGAVASGRIAEAVAERSIRSQEGRRSV